MISPARLAADRVVWRRSQACKNFIKAQLAGESAGPEEMQRARLTAVALI
jgi:hypothetical protein